MQICQDHWHELKRAIRQRGMGKLVSPDPAHNRPAPSTPGFDPLGMVSVMISHQARMALGEYLETRSFCPLCEVEQNMGKGRSFEWIDVDADTILAVCKQRKLIREE
jgi:hypothetical protein